MQRAMIGDVNELRATGRLAGKVGSQPVCVWWSDGQAYAVDDRCPHMGFPLHRGTVENGLLTCHWHHARFDLASGGTLDPFADDVRAHEVKIEGTRVYVTLRPDADAAGHHLQRLTEGLEQGLSLVIAKAVLGLLDLEGPDDGANAAVQAGINFGVRNRQAGWGAGLTVLTAMANVLPVLQPGDRALALVHGLAFVSRDTRGRPPRFPLAPLPADIPPARLASWYRRFVDTRNGDAAERVLATAATAASPSELPALMGAAVTDHMFVDGGHTIDFTNKAFEALDRLGWEEQAATIATTLAHQTAGASRSEETGQWRHPFDLVGLLASIQTQGVPLILSKENGLTGETGATREASESDIERLADAVLGDDPGDIVARLDNATRQGATFEQLARAVAYAAALRLVRFHTQNDHGDWDVVHHAFTAANATHQLIRRAPTSELARGVYHAAMRVFLDRFLNIPAARSPAQHRLAAERPNLAELQPCWDHEGMVDEAGALVYGWLHSGGDQQAVMGALGAALLAEDAEFHWYQTYEAAVRQAWAWPVGSEPAALILSGLARFLAAHTPTRRELAQVVRIATRLRRGDALYEEI
jgi:nitrite reductase/ring-hydroxylating ferredoxin subunit